MTHAQDKINEAVAEYFDHLAGEQMLPETPTKALWALFPAVKYAFYGTASIVEAPAPTWSVRVKISIKPTGEPIWHDNVYQPAPVAVYSRLDVLQIVQEYVLKELTFLPTCMSWEALEGKINSMSVGLSNGDGMTALQWLFKQNPHIVDVLGREYNVRAIVARGNCVEDKSVREKLANGSYSFPHIDDPKPIPKSLRVGKPD